MIELNDISSSVVKYAGIFQIIDYAYGYPSGRVDFNESQEPAAVDIEESSCSSPVNLKGSLTFPGAVALSSRGRDGERSGKRRFLRK